MDRVIYCGHIICGKFAGQRWEIIRQSGGAPYRLNIAGEFWANADSRSELFDEISALESVSHDNKKKEA